MTGSDPWTRLRALATLLAVAAIALALEAGRRWV